MESDFLISNSVDESDLIDRDNHICTIDKILTGETKLLFIEGEEGIGKTTLLKEYSKKNQTSTIHIELDVSCKWGSDIRFFTYLLYTKLYGFLNGVECNLDNIDIPDGELLEILMLVNKTLAKRKEFLTILVDGLDEISVNDSQTIINHLPISNYFSTYKFIVTGDSSNLSKYFKCNYIKPYILSGFTFNESKEYLSKFIAEPEIISEIAKTSNGNPGYLSSIKRMINSGLTPQAVVNQLPDNLPKALLNEWNLANITDTNLLKVLCLVANECSPYTVQQISSIFDTEEEYILQELTKHEFIIINEGVVTFISDAFRRFIEKQLSSLKNEVYDQLIGYLSINPYSDMSLDSLPHIYYYKEQYIDLLSYLSDDVLYQVVTKASSLKTLKKHIDIGLLSALRVKKPEVMIGYAIKSAAVASLNEDKVWKTEIDALMSLGEITKAIEIANGAVLIEDRLAAYAQICRHKANKGEAVDTTMIETIKVTITNMDTTMLGDRAIEIAMDISTFDPELSINLIKSSLNVENDPNSTDFAFTKLAIASMFRRSLSEDKDASDMFNKHIANPSLQDITKGFQIISQQKTAVDLVKSVQDIADTSIQVRFLCEWIKVNRRNTDAIDVTQYGIDLVIRKTDYSPNSRVFYDLISPIEFSDVQDVVMYVINNIDHQLPNLKLIGPYEDYLRLQIMLAIGRSRFDSNDAYDRLSKVFYEVSEQSNLIMKCNTYTRLLHALMLIKEKSTRPIDEELEYVVRDEVNSVVNVVFEALADHFDALKNTLGTLCLYDLDLTLNIIQKMNTKYRKDLSADLVIRSYIDQKGVSGITAQHIEILNSISNTKIREELVLYILEKTMYDGAEQTRSNHLPSIVKAVPEFKNDYRRCNALCLLARYQNRFCDDKIIPLNDIIDSITKLWSSIDNTWFKIDMGYMIVGSLAEIDKALSISFLEKTKQERESCVINSYSLAETNIYTILLAIRAFTGLLDQKEDTKDDLDGLISRISRFPSIVTQVRLLSDLSIRSHFANRRDVSDAICIDHLQSMVSKHYDNQGLRNAVLYEATPAMYLYHSTTALTELAKLPSNIKEKAACNTIRCILSKVSLLDPIERPKSHFKKITYQQIDDVLRLLELIKTDHVLYDVISNIADIFVYNERNSDYYIDRLQKTEVERRLNSIIETALPWPDGIIHDGFLLICKAQLFRMFKPKDTSAWKKLVGQAKAIPNLADRCYVLSVIYSFVTRKVADQNVLTINEIEDEIDKLPIDFEKSEHLFIMAKYVYETNKQISKDLVKKAWALIATDNDSDHKETMKELIDFTYNLDHDLAASFASMLDDDPARSVIRNDLKRQINVLELKNELFKKPVERNDYGKSSKRIAEASWQYLASLNSNNIVACAHQDYVTSEITEAAKYGISESYPIFACVIENLVVKNKATQQARTILRPLFNYMLSTSDMILQLTTQVTSGSFNQFIRPPSSTKSDTIMFVEIDQRDRAISFIQKWIADSCDEYLFLCDQYLSANELDILLFIKAAKPELNVIIITSIASNPGDDIKNKYIEAWRVKSTDDPIPATVYLMDYGAKHESPIHDRWWISRTSGLDMGTSFNSLGKKASKIRIMENDEVQLHYQEIIDFITRRVILKNGIRIRYDSFVLE